jgi:hypothetical protein
MDLNDASGKSCKIYSMEKEIQAGFAVKPLALERGANLE